MRQEKNYWPHAIVGILVFGVFMVGTSITIALKNPIQDENTFFGKKREIDERINDIIKAQQEFNALFSSHFFLQSSDSEISESSPESHKIAFSFPYETKPKRGKEKENIPHLTPGSHLLLALTPRVSESSSASDSRPALDSHPASHPASHSTSHAAQITALKLFLDSTHEAGKLQELGSLEPFQSTAQDTAPNIANFAQKHALKDISQLYLSPTLTSLPKGRWKLIVEIDYRPSRAALDSEPQKAYFEAVVLISES